LKVTIEFLAVLRNERGLEILELLSFKSAEKGNSFKEVKVKSLFIIVVDSEVNDLFNVLLNQLKSSKSDLKALKTLR
jgi:hemerythrin superfamily protein